MQSQRSHVIYEIGGIRVRSFIDNNNARISNLGQPIASTDAATKAYVDANITSSEMFAGTGLTKTGTTFSVNNNLSNVTGLGNINSGTWSANTINVPYGGTGRSVFTANKLLMGDGTNPIVSISEISFENSRLQSTAPIFISNTSSGSSLASGGSFVTLGGASFSGKVWIGNDLNISGDVTLGNLRITGSSNFSSISASDAVYTTATATNLLNVNITSSNVVIANSRLTNITNTNTLSTNNTTTNLRTTNLSTSNLYVTNDIVSTNLSLSQITTSSLLSTFIRSTNITTTLLLVTNFTSSNGFVANMNSITVSSANIWSISSSSTYINATNANLSTTTTDNLTVNGPSVLATTTISNLVSSSITVPNILVTNLRTTNITTNSLVNVSTISTNITTTNLSTTNLINTNITTSSIVTSNISASNLTTTNITSSTLKVSNLTTLSTTNIISLSTETLNVTGMTTLTNTSVNNVTASNITNTNITTANINTTNITASNININNITTLGTVGSINLSTGNIHSSSTTTLNRQTSVTATIGNLRVTNTSILATVNSDNLSTGNIFVSTSITAPLINNTSQTSTNLSVTNVRGTHISSSTLRVTGTSIVGILNSINLSTGNIAAIGLTQLNNITANNSSISNIVTTNVSSASIIATNNATINQTVNIGSNFSGTSNTTSGNILNIIPSVFTDNTTPEGFTLQRWSTAFFGNSTISAQNNITTRKISTVYIQRDPIVGLNQSIENSAALAIGYVNNATGGNLSGQIILERNDGNWYGSIFTEASTNKVVIANASLSGGGGIGFYTYNGTKVSLANIPSATNITPTTYLEFASDTTYFYSTTESSTTTTGSVVLAGGLGVSKTITCQSIQPTNILASIRTLQDVDPTMTPANGEALVWNGSVWTAGAGTGSTGGSGGGTGTTGGSIGPTNVQVYPMTLVMPIMTSNGPEAGPDGNYYVSASSEFSEAYAAYKCLSNIILPSDWTTAGENVDFWIKIQLPSSQNVRYVVLEGRINNEDPLTITIQGSNDDITYTDLITNETFTALNYTGYFSARIPENSKDYLYYKFLFPTALGINPGLNMLRLFKYDNSTYTEGILDNSSIEGNGIFNKAVINGRWPMSFDLDSSTIVNIRAQITCFTSSSFVLRKFVMYINGAPFQNDGSTFIKQYLHQNLHTSIQTLEWTGSLPEGIHTLSFFVDGGTGVNFDINDNIRVHVVKY